MPHEKDLHEVLFRHVPTGTHWTLSFRPKDFRRFATLLREPDSKDPRSKPTQKRLRRRAGLSPKMREHIKHDTEGVSEGQPEEADAASVHWTPERERPVPRALPKTVRGGEALVEWLRDVLTEVVEPWNTMGTDWNALEERRRGLVVCGFIELSRTSLIGVWEYGMKGKEGWVKKRRGGRKNDVFCFPDFLVPRTSQYRWLALRSNYLLYFYSPMDLTPQEVMLIDGYFQVLHKDTQKRQINLHPEDEDPTGNDEDRVSNHPGGRQHHAMRNAIVLRPFNRRTNEIWVKDKHRIAILNGFRDLLIDCEHVLSGRGQVRVAREWVEQLEYRRHNTSWFRDTQIGTPGARYDSFAPVRRGIPSESLRWMVDGSAHFEQMYHAIAGAEHEILIADWFITPEIFLRRGADGLHPENLPTRLDRLLYKKANEGVRIYILLYKELNLPNASMHAKEVFMGRKKPHYLLDAAIEDPDHDFELKQPQNIVVLRHPDQGRGFIGPVLDTVMWAHHEKAAVIDRKIGFIGGIDLCVGRFDTAEHTLRDDLMYNQHGDVEEDLSAVKPIVKDPPSLLSPLGGTSTAHTHSQVECSPLVHEIIAMTEPHKAEDGTGPGGSYPAPPVPMKDNQEVDGSIQNGQFLAPAAEGSSQNPYAGPQLDTPKLGGGNAAAGFRPARGVVSRTMSSGSVDDPNIMPTSVYLPTTGRMTTHQGKRGDAPRRALNDLDESSRPLANIFPGQDYSNPRVRDFVRLAEAPFDESIPRDHTARMPWHDVACQFRKLPGEENVEGPVDDLVWHFIQRWNFAKWEKKKTDHVIPWLYPTQGLHPATKEMVDRNSVEVQILRSASQWSAGAPREKSISNAYVDLIHKAQHYVYIENQFFITKYEPAASHIPGEKGGNASTDPHSSHSHHIPSRRGRGQKLPISRVRVHNPIASALAYRILRAHKAHQPFKAFVVIPLYPAFHGDISKPDSDPALAYVLCAQTECIRGFYTQLEKGGIPRGEIGKYVAFIGLRKWDVLGERLVTEQIYVHAKVMIVDDKCALIGSANINDRSLMGSRDSELAIVMTDTAAVPTKMAGQPFSASRFPLALRLRLFHEHLGIPFPEALTDVFDSTATHLPASSYTSDPSILDPVSDACWDKWQTTLDVNTRTLRHVFHVVPDDTVTNWRTYKEFLKSRGGALEDDMERNMSDMAKEQGVPIALRLQDLIDDQELDAATTETGPVLLKQGEENSLAHEILRRRVRGHAVRFPVHYLEEEELSALFKGVHKMAPRRVFT
ncbi:hypothetical protein DFS34DRAFT_601037 [Phlyctochytrium arcticum]|nr:hypothetical protein DFS34DRAFT_601037 [Phlyctochytrium arcticum]